MGVLMVGRFSAEQAEAIKMAISRASLTVRIAADALAARRLLNESNAAIPNLILVDAAMVELQPLLTWIRGEAALFGVLVVTIVPAASDHGFVQAHQFGADDAILRGDLGAITRRAASLDKYDPSLRPPITQGRAILAHDDIHRRRSLGRSLRLAGFDVVFAADAEEVGEQAGRGEPPALVVAAETLDQGALQAILAARQSAAKAMASVIVGSAEQLRSLDDEVYDLSGIGSVDADAPPDHLLFVANELMRPGVQNLRASARVLYGALCAFRPAGELHPVLGLTYNVSREGLYVRTLDPPQRGSSLWFELRPPTGQQAVHLRGTVMWVRDMQRGPGGAAPPGFGVRIIEEACPPGDLQAYRQGYEEFCAGR